MVFHICRVPLLKDPVFLIFVDELIKANKAAKKPVVKPVVTAVNTQQNKPQQSNKLQNNHNQSRKNSKFSNKPKTPVADARDRNSNARYNTVSKRRGLPVII